MKKLICLTAAIFLPSCGNREKNVGIDNPLLAKFETPFGVPAFDKIKLEHYEPAFEEAMKRHMDEISVIVNNTDAPTFANTIEAMDTSGELLGQVSSIFFNLTSAHTSDSMQALAKRIAPLLSKHGDDIILNPELFKKVKAVYEARETSNLTHEQQRTVEEYYKDFIRGGANLSPEKQARFREINEKLSMLTLQFGDNVLADNNDFKLIIENKEELAGLPQSIIDAAASAAKENNLEGQWLFTVDKPSMIPFLQYSENRDLREKIYRAYFMRGNNNNSHDNKDIIKEIISLRNERAQLLGFENHAAFVLDRNMAKEPANVYKLLNRIWQAALPVAKKEVQDMQSIIDNKGDTFKLASWDWWYYAEKVRKEKYDLDEEMLRPYFKLENVRDGVFDVSNMLYGITFHERTDLPKYQEDVTSYEVKDADGSHLGILYLDFYPRPTKRGGAWCTSFREQYTKAGKKITPVVSIVCNFTKPTSELPALLNYDEVETFFHEFGHALHALFSDCNYKRISGTAVPRDFVELPSQVMENWAAEPEVMKNYAKHYKTGETIPDELIEKIKNSAHFNQGFATVEYLAASFLDMDYHTAAQPAKLDVLKFEDESMAKIGLIKEIIPRYRSTYFNHAFSLGYSAGYYSYIWAEVLDSDAFAAFKETGNIFDPETAKKFREEILSKGGMDDAMTLYLNFRGKEPKIEPLLKNRGLL